MRQVTAITVSNGIWNRLSRFLLAGVLLLAAVGVAATRSVAAMARGSHVATERAEKQKLHALEAYGRLPLSFEANEGQTDAAVNFISRGNGFTLFLKSNEAALLLRNPQSATCPGNVGIRDPQFLRMKLLGTNAAPRILGLEEQPGKSNYLIGNNWSRWRTDVRSYARVRYSEVYPGIDLVYYGNQGQVEYDFVVAAGADPKLIHFEVEGAEAPAVDARGSLRLRTAAGEVLLHRPVVYQQVNGARRETSGRYVIKNGREIAFAVGHYDRRRPLFIDPVLSYSTYFGGSGGETGYRIAVDSDGNAYITGSTNSADLPLVKPLQAASGGSTDVFVAKLNASGTALIYSTYLGGANADTARGIAVDASGNAYVTGTTQSPNFPTTAGALQTSPGPGFIAKLNADGNALVYSTFIAAEDPNGIAVDAAGSAYVTGSTSLPAFPTTRGVFQGLPAGSTDAFVLKLNAAGSELVYATYLGGSAADAAYAIAVDSSGNAYVAGATASPDFPTANPLQAQLAGSILYKTSDGAGSWSGIGKGLKAVAVRALVIDPKNTSTLYAGGDKGMFKSTDGGNNWTALGLVDHAVTALMVDPTDSSVVYAGTEAGIFRSTNYGASWGATNMDENRNVRVLVADPKVPTTLWAGTDAGVFKSADRGNNWGFMNVGGFTNALVMNPKNTLTVYAGSNWNGVYRSVDGGNTWTPAQDMSGHSVYALVIDPTNPGVLYAGTDAGVFITSDTGDTWVPSSGLTTRPVYALAIDPTSLGTTTMYAATDNGVYKADRTSIWRPMNNGLGKSLIPILVMNPTAPSTLYASTAGGTDAFVAKINAAGSALVYSTYLGGIVDETAYGIAVDSAGSAYVTGKTNSGDFPTTPGAFRTQCARAGGSSTAACSSDVFVAKLTAAGSGLVYSTYLGGAADDAGYAIALDSSGGAYVTGSTLSVDFPTAKPVQPNYTGAGDAFVAKLNPAGSSLLYSTYLGGSNTDEGRGLAVDGAGSAYLVGTTNSANFPVAVPLQSSNWGRGSGNAFVAKLTITPAPVLSSISPSIATGGGPAFTLTVNGSGFVSASIVRWNGSDRPTTFVSATQLQASIPAGDIAAPGTPQVTVFTPPPDGGLSGSLTFTINAPILPAINSGGILNGASFSAQLAGGSIASLFGVNFAATPQGAAGLPLPITLGGVTVFVNGTAAPLFYVSPKQINLQMPWEALGQAQATITVTATSGASAPQTIALSSFAPAIFTNNSAGTGQGAVLIASSGEVAAPAGSITGAAARPVARGEYLSIFCTGLGDVSNRPATGGIASGSSLSVTTSTPSATIGGVPATVSFSGLAPGFAGLYQVNVQVPDAAPTGNAVSLVLSIGGAGSNTVNIAIQ